MPTTDVMAPDGGFREKPSKTFRLDNTKFTAQVVSDIIANPSIVEIITEKPSDALRLERIFKNTHFDVLKKNPDTHASGLYLSINAATIVSGDVLKEVENRLKDIMASQKNFETAVTESSNGVVKRVLQGVYKAVKDSYDIDVVGREKIRVPMKVLRDFLQKDRITQEIFLPGASPEEARNVQSLVLEMGDAITALIEYDLHGKDKKNAGEIAAFESFKTRLNSELVNAISDIRNSRQDGLSA
jgi:hypothetical protein